MKKELVQAFTGQAWRLFSLCKTYIDGSYSPDEKEPLLELIEKLYNGLEVDFGKMFEEITANLDEPMTDQQRERYCFSLITPFEAYSNTLYPRVLIGKSQESLTRLQGIDGTDKLVSIYENQIKDANERANKYFGLGFGADGLLTSDEAKSIFFELAQIVTGYANMIDAALVMYGLDLKQLQERCGVRIKQFIGGEAEKSVRAMQIKGYVGSLTLAEVYISRLEPQEVTEIELQTSAKQEPQQAEQGQKKDLHYYCKKAIKKGYLEKKGDGYRIKNKVWTKRQLVYFLGYFLKADGTFPDKEYCLMFGETRLSKELSALADNKTGDGKPRGYKLIDELLKE